MCGICGEVTFDGTGADVAAVARMTDVMTPRGPTAAASGPRARSRSATAV